MRRGLDDPHGFPFAAEEAEEEGDPEETDIGGSDEPPRGHPGVEDDEGDPARDDKRSDGEGDEQVHDEPGVARALDCRGEYDVHGVEERVERDEPEEDERRIADSLAPVLP